MGYALKAEPLFVSVSQSTTVNPSHRAAIRAVVFSQLSDEALELLEFRCQGLQALVDLDALRVEELMRD